MRQEKRSPGALAGAAGAIENDVYEDLQVSDFHRPWQLVRWTPDGRLAITATAAKRSEIAAIAIHHRGAFIVFRPTAPVEPESRY